MERLFTKMDKIKRIGFNLFFALAMLGALDMMVNVWTSGEVRLIHRFLAIFFPKTNEGNNERPKILPTNFRKRLC